jgi:hypothetical protein
MQRNKALYSQSSVPPKPERASQPIRAQRKQLSLILARSSTRSLTARDLSKADSGSVAVLDLFYHIIALVQEQRRRSLLVSTFLYYQALLEIRRLRDIINKEGPDNSAVDRVDARFPC